MSKIAVQKFQKSETIPRSLSEEMAGLTKAIRERAFSLFQARSGESGSDLDDWLRAEREMLWTPTSELIEQDGELRARIALPGFDPSEIDLTAMPDALVVKAENVRHTHQSDQPNVRFCEFSSKKLFRRIDMPTPIDVDKVSASLDKGILQITAAKAPQPKAKTGSAAA